MVFDKRQTNIAKGVALLLLLWHHLFYNSPAYYDKFVSLFSIKGIPAECYIAVFCKVCVSIFLFLSGYGLYKSYDSYIKKVNAKSNFNIKEDLIFVKNHLIKLMSEYWFIYVIFVSMGFFINRNPIEIYRGNVLYFILDFFGLSNIFKTPTMNPTWWFMSLIIILYILFPLLYKLLKYSPEMLLLGSFFVLVFYFLPELFGLRIYLFPFIFGMYFSVNDMFSKIESRLNKPLKILLVPLLSFIITLWLKATVFIKGAEIDGFFAVSIICVSYLVLSRIPVLNKCLESIGKLSGSIFMFHTFIFSFYFSDLIYASKYSIMIYIVMVVVCYLVAVIISYLQKLIRYDEFIEHLIKRKNEVCSDV